VTPRKIIVSLSLVSVLLVLLSTTPLAQTVHPKGVTIWNPFTARNGLTLFNAPDGTARLVDMTGNLVMTWAAAALGTSDDALLVEVPIFASPGHILAIHSALTQYGPARGSALAELDLSGYPVWDYNPGPTLGPFQFAGFHHDMVRLDNGNTLALASVLVDGTPISPKTLLDDCVIEITPTGQIPWVFFTFLHFDDFGFTDAGKAQISTAGGDWAHANAIAVVPPNDLGDSRFAAGNVIISYRNLNTFIVVDKSTGQIVWKSGPNDNLTIGQHNVHMIQQGLQGAGHILAFDNGGSGGYPPTFRSFSRVVEIDPLTRALPWTYTAANSGFQSFALFSPIISSAQRLQAGNTLITEGTKGRIFEVTSTGALVWEFMSPFTEMRNDSGYAVSDTWIYRAYRLPVSGAQQASGTASGAWLSTVVTLRP